ncbi:LuxR family transcriptional regulator [Microbacterium sp.]|uniref:LuxR family transcriptional regulator n=1 Tax=Microbacterium sp. TaxID=51671 RepID=UPI00261EF9B3|nr:LuxR family transcriptional regulator [Microbacterium sp.]
MTILANAPTAIEPYQARRSPQADEVPFLWMHQIRSVIDAAAERTPRAVLVGNAGSGKSSTLRHLHTVLVESGHDVVTAAGSTNISRTAQGQVLLVDDLDRLSAAQLAQVRDRAENADAALIAAVRPSTWTAAVIDIVRALERSRPAIVLGHLARSDVLSYLEQHDLYLQPTCLTSILEMTGGSSWLVAEALAAHDDRDCEGGDHRELRGMIEQHIAHRLDTIDARLRRDIEQICIAPPGRSLPSDEPRAFGASAAGYAEGLLLRNGQPVPLVRSAVHATIAVQRLVELSGDLAASLAHSAANGDVGHQTWIGLLHDRELGDALSRHADRMRDSDPARASELYTAAVRSGVDAAALVGRRAQAAWAAGDLDAASALIEQSAGQHDELTVDTAAAIWSARGMMDQACATYRATPVSNAISATRAAVAAVGCGASDAVGTSTPSDSSAAPSVLGVSMSLLRRGLETSVTTGDAEGALADLVRASEMFTTAGTADGIPELPAVIAAIVALNLGGLATASSVIDNAIAGSQGGPWARPRLLLWRAWIAVQRAQPAEARAALAEAGDLTAALSPRDTLLAHAVDVAIARRYDDAAGLESAWRQARASLLRVDVDLYLLHPLAELISSASRVGDTERIQPQFARALEITEALGSPVLWSAHLRWAGIQNGILRGTAESIRGHAKALVDASEGSRIAATMAKAGRVWTSVLGGTVDADAIEKAARGLASIGLMWDAARLAGHGAARADDRKISARLLACARELHPIDGSRRAAAAAAAVRHADDHPGDATPAEAVLSEREIEVARLVVEGKTYAEIGETIFISPRTAEHHIAHIRRRLGATSRSEVIAKLRHLLGAQSAPAAPARAYPKDADTSP